MFCSVKTAYSSALFREKLKSVANANLKIFFYLKLLQTILLQKCCENNCHPRVSIVFSLTKAKC